MEELLDLHDALTQHRYDEALEIVEEMTAMAKKEIIGRIGSYIRIVLIHIIKSHAEQQMTRSWRVSVRYALEKIEEENQRDYAKGSYMNTAALREMIEKKFAGALEKASLEAFEGKYSPREFAKFIDAEAVKTQALDYILNGYPENEDY